MFVIKCGKIVTVTGPVVNNGAVLIENGKIKAVLGENEAIPTGTEIVDASDKWAYPGFIEASSHIGANKEPNDFSVNFDDGIRDGMDTSESASPQLDVTYSINPCDASIERVRSSGITTCFVATGPTSMIDGQGIAIKMNRSALIDDIVIENSRQMCFTLGDEALMTSKKKKHPPFTRMALADMLRETLKNAKEYSQASEGDRKYDRKLEAILPVVKGEMKVRFECLRADDIVTGIKIAEEFNLKYVIAGAFEAHKVADYLKEHGTEVILEAAPFGPMRCMSLIPYYDFTYETAAILEKKGVRFCISENENGETKYLPMLAGFVTAHGLSPKRALEAVTIDAAKTLGLDLRIGSIEVGKDADIAIFNGDALVNTSSCLMSIVNGEIIYSK